MPGPIPVPAFELPDILRYCHIYKHKQAIICFPSVRFTSPPVCFPSPMHRLSPVRRPSPPVTTRETCVVTAPTAELSVGRQYWRNSIRVTHSLGLAARESDHLVTNPSISRTKFTLKEVLTHARPRPADQVTLTSHLSITQNPTRLRYDDDDIWYTTTGTYWDNIIPTSILKNPLSSVTFTFKLLPTT